MLKDTLDKKMDSSRFPDSFMLGTSTSAFQVEGEGKTEWSGFTGEDGRSPGEVTLSSADEVSLTSYLKGTYDEATFLGGLHVNLWLCGQDILYDLTGGVAGPTAAEVRVPDR